MRLYHFSNVELDQIKVKHFGDNIYTDRDVKASGVKRAFYYIRPEPLEYRFKKTKYLYTVDIDKNKLYDLREDKNKLVKKYSQSGVCDIEKLLIYLKKQYRGVIYNTCGLDIACLFCDVKPITSIWRIL